MVLFTLIQWLHEPGMKKKIVVMLSGIILEIKYQRPEYLYNISELI